MQEVVFRNRARQLDRQDIRFIRALISKHNQRGRSHISRALCCAWEWVQPNGKLKEYAARDLLLRLEEQGFIELPKRLRQKNNLKKKSFEQIPLFLKQPINGSAGDYERPCIELVHSQGSYLWDYWLKLNDVRKELLPISDFRACHESRVHQHASNPVCSVQVAVE